MGHVAVIPFDVDRAFNGLSHDTVKFRVSDHRPIWIRFRTDLPHDD